MASQTYDVDADYADLRQMMESAEAFCLEHDEKLEKEREERKTLERIEEEIWRLRRKALKRPTSQSRLFRLAYAEIKAQAAAQAVAPVVVPPTISTEKLQLTAVAAKNSAVSDKVKSLVPRQIPALRKKSKGRRCPQKHQSSTQPPKLQSAQQ